MIVRIVSATSTSKIDLPPPTVTHFYTANRALSFFPMINRNGYTFEKQNVSEDIVKTLLASTVDIQHVKPSYGEADASHPGQDNLTIGAVANYAMHDEGIDVAHKIERSVAKHYGYTPEDFGPGGILGQVSQECDWSPQTSYFISIDKSDPKKIVSKWSYADGIANGFKDPQAGETGPFGEVDGNKVYFSLVPLSFSGIGHVRVPADPSAQTYKVAASAKNASDYPGMDTVEPSPRLLVGDVNNTTDMNVFANDLLTHPDLLTAAVDKHYKEEDDPKAPDDHYAASFTFSDYSNIVDNKPQDKKVRLFRIKNEKGALDRNRLIAAYHQLYGVRGAVEKRHQLSDATRIHALHKVRQGLKETLPTNKEKSSMLDADKEALEAKARELIAAQKLVSSADHEAVITERDAVKADLAKAVSALEVANATIETLKGEVSERDGKLAEITARELASARLVELEKVLAFSEDEKKDEKFGEYVASLAKLSDEGFKIEALQRTVAAYQKNVAAKTVSGVANPVLNPVPEFSLNSVGEGLAY